MNHYLYRIYPGFQLWYFNVCILKQGHMHNRLVALEVRFVHTLCIWVLLISLSFTSSFLWCCNWFWKHSHETYWTLHYSYYVGNYLFLITFSCTSECGVYTSLTVVQSSIVTISSTSNKLMYPSSITTWYICDVLISSYFWSVGCCLKVLLLLIYISPRAYLLLQNMYDTMLGR